ncbi:MAG: tetratricopeptide repeat protein [Gemmatimonadota bacterium]|nr:tetratricopeptide repeat protein [Gemmatimonadota bacterium]
MYAWSRTALSSLALSATVVGGAIAQNPPASTASSCNVDIGGAYQLTSANVYIEKASSGSSKADEKTRHMRDAMKNLTENPDKIGNQVGRNWLLGRALYWWADQPGQPLVVKRGAIGYASDPNGMVDIYAAMDTSFSAVAAAKPECLADIRRFRSKPFATAINGAGELIQQENLDSAQALVKMAMRVDPTSPFPMYYQAIIHQKKNDLPAALADFRKTIELITPALLTSDSTVAKIRRQALFNEGVLMLNQAGTLTGDAKAQAIRQSVEVMRQYLKEYPQGENAGQAQTALAQALASSGDTAAVADIFADMLKDPAKYTDAQLVDAGVGAIRGKRYAEAAQLLQSVHDRNGYYRDALYNLGLAYLDGGQYEKALPIARRAVDVDPMNELNWKLLAEIYKGLANKQIAAKAKRDTIVALQNQTLKFIGKADSLPVRVSISQFSHNGAAHTLAGSVENRGATPKNVIVNFEFLDKSGAAVAKQEQALSLPAHGKKDFSVQVNQTGIVAFRYSPIAG